MILVDTSVWVEHLRSGNATLAEELGAGRLLAHPFVIGELACGNLKNRRQMLDLLGRLPSVPTATHAEALGFLERRALMGRGIGFMTCTCWPRRPSPPRRGCGPATGASRRLPPS